MLGTYIFVFFSFSVSIEMAELEYIQRREYASSSCTYKKLPQKKFLTPVYELLYAYVFAADRIQMRDAALPQLYDGYGASIVVFLTWGYT